MGILNNLIISSTGDVGYETSRLRKWVEANGGKWMSKVQRGLTHLIATKDAWKRGNEAVKQAKALDAHIVSFDWLEDSLQARRKIAEKKYTWDVLRNGRKRRKDIKRLGAQADTQKFVKGCQLAQEDTGSGEFSNSSPLESPSASRRMKGMFVSALEDLQRRRREREAKAAMEEKQFTATPSTTKHFKTSLKDSELQQQPNIISTGIHFRIANDESSAPDKSAASGQQNSPQRSSSTTVAASVAVPPAPPSSNAIAATTSTTSTQKTKKLTDLYHLYLDHSGFEYNITLLRTNLYLNTHARYNLRLYESHTKPYVYCTVVKYIPPPVTCNEVTEDSVAFITGRGRIRGSSVRANAGPSNTTTSATTTAVTASTSSTDFEHAQSQASVVEQDSLPLLPPTAHPEATRLAALIARPSVPPDTEPLTKLLAPHNSSFEIAFLAFRQAFHDCTLIPWEDRFRDTPDKRTLQQARAKFYGVEPYVYAKPKMGMPVGTMPSVRLEEEKNEKMIKRKDDEYVRNRFGLPGLNAPLKGEGVIGAAIKREEEAAETARLERERAQEERQKKARELAKGQQRKMTFEAAQKKGAKADYRKPLFDGGGPGKEEVEKGLARQIASMNGNAIVTGFGNKRWSPFLHSE